MMENSLQSSGSWASDNSFDTFGFVAPKTEPVEKTPEEAFLEEQYALGSSIGDPGVNVTLPELTALFDAPSLSGMHPLTVSDEIKMQDQQKHLQQLLFDNSGMDNNPGMMFANDPPVAPTPSLRASLDLVQTTHAHEHSSHSPLSSNQCSAVETMATRLTMWHRMRAGQKWEWRPVGQKEEIRVTRNRGKLFKVYLECDFPFTQADINVYFVDLTTSPNSISSSSSSPISSPTASPPTPPHNLLDCFVIQNISRVEATQYDNRTVYGMELKIKLSLVCRAVQLCISINSRGQLHVARSPEFTTHNNGKQNKPRQKKENANDKRYKKLKCEIDDEIVSPPIIVGQDMQPGTAYNVARPPPAPVRDTEAAISDMMLTHINNSAPFLEDPSPARAQNTDQTHPAVTSPGEPHHPGTGRRDHHVIDIRESAGGSDKSCSSGSVSGSSTSGSFSSVSSGASIGTTKVQKNSTTKRRRPRNKGHLSIKGGLNVDGIVRAHGFMQYSDIRLKTNIEDIVNAVELISKLEGKRYRWKSDLEREGVEKPALQDGGMKVIGLIAQEVQKVLPEVVREDQDGWLSVSYVEIIPVLIEAFNQHMDTYHKEQKEFRVEFEEWKRKVVDTQNQVHSTPIHRVIADEQDDVELRSVTETDEPDDAGRYCDSGSDEHGSFISMDMDLQSIVSNKEELSRLAEEMGSLIPEKQYSDLLRYLKKEKRKAKLRRNLHCFVFMVCCLLIFVINIALAAGIPVGISWILNREL